MNGLLSGPFTVPVTVAARADNEPAAIKPRNVRKLRNERMAPPLCWYALVWSSVNRPDLTSLLTTLPGKNPLSWRRTAPWMMRTNQYRTLGNRRMRHPKIRANVEGRPLARESGWPAQTLRTTYLNYYMKNITNYL